jgi:hypothetical protein
MGPYKSTKYSSASFIEHGVGNGCLIGPFFMDKGFGTKTKCCSSLNPRILAHSLTFSSLFYGNIAKFVAVSYYKPEFSRS